MSTGNPFPTTVSPDTTLRWSDAYRTYAIALIWLVLLLRFVDLQIISVLLESIRKDFAVSDSQLGLLSGFAFSLLYGALGIPVARLSDRTNRRNIIAAAVGLWSAMTALCGTATSFATLLLTRVGVGIGEAGGSPPAYSLISDQVGPEQRARVFAILNTSVPAGVFFGLLFGGYINATFGWRAAFLSLGIPGILVAILVLLTLREPQRRSANEKSRSQPQEKLGTAVMQLTQRRSYRHLVLASTIFTVGAMGSGIWLPSFFIRVHHMAPTEATTWLACIYGGGGVVGALLGGYLADHRANQTHDKRWHAWLACASTAAILPFSFFVYLWPSPIPALIVHIGTTILMHAWMGPTYGVIQSLAGARRRATAAGLNLLTINLVAYGMGPLVIGMLSDFFGARFGNDSLRYSILSLVVITYTWAAVHFYRAAATLRQDLRAAEAEDVPVAAG